MSTTKQLAEQHIKSTRRDEIIKLSKTGLNPIYGGTKDDLSPADLYGQAVISEYLKQQRKEIEMKTEQEQIEQIEKVLKYAVADYKHLKKKGVCYCYAETLIDCGYGDISEYKAEIEQLKADLDHQINATNDAENLVSYLQHDYDKCFKRLKSTQKELNELKDKLKSIAYVEPIKDVVIIKRSDFDNLIEEVQK